MIIGDIETTEKVEYEDLLKNYYEKMEIIEEQDKEIERLNKLISQREKKWEKWTTEKTILSTKMSDYLCKYQNIKREYTKQIKISTDRKNEIERLKEDNEYLNKVNIELSTEKNRLNNIINELEKYIVIKLKEFNTPEEYYTLKQIDDIHYRLQELKGSDK